VTGPPDPATPSPPHAVCAGCGTVAADGAPATWSTTLEPGRGVRRLCERCTRQNLRAIEARLAEPWW
jgi:hypothetical protein